MPNTASAKKRLRQNEARNLRNRASKSNMRTQLRKVREAVKAGDAEKAEAEFRLAVKKLDKAGRQQVDSPQRRRAHQVASLEGDQGDGKKPTRVDFFQGFGTTTRSSDASKTGPSTQGAFPVPRTIFLTHLCGRT